MGIQGLKKLISDNAPEAYRDHALDSYFGRKIAVDASMHIYQFMAVVGRQGDQVLTNADGEVTAHLVGMMYRTSRLLEAGVKPVYVFDGKPPTLKGGELAKRGAKREEAKQQLKEAKERGDEATVEKLSKRTMRVTRQHNEECKRLLRLMGVPIVEAPCEAEAQCAELCKAGKVYSVATEDMDCLTFATVRQSRNMMAPASQKKEIQEFQVQKVLEGLDLTLDQFIDMCILCGCDYCDKIKGIGPNKALDLIKKHGNIETILEKVDTTKFIVPDNFPYKEARVLFKAPEVTQADKIPPFAWKLPDEEGLIAYLVDEKNFDRARVENVIKKIKAAKGKSSQGRLESFFGPVKYRTGVKKDNSKSSKSKGGKFGKSIGISKKKK
jgi:flap endonuclease-1